MKCRIILELLAILFFTGCYNREQISRLDEAEALIQNKPDSALTILQQLKSEGSQAEQAKYALLYSEALDKNHIKATNDSDRKSTRLNSSHTLASRMPSSA